MTGLHADVRLRLGTLDLATVLTVRSREVVAVLGPNGSGKTTLLSTVAGLRPVQSGRITMDGNIWDDPQTRAWTPPERRGVGLVLADHLLFPHLSTGDNVAFGPRSRGVDRRTARALAVTELEAVGLGDLASSRPRELSSGQSQRVALARALATDPAVLLLDEPLSALDPATRAQTRADLRRRLSTYAGATVLVTHDPLDALSLADRLVFLDAGRVVQEGTPQDVVAHPRSPYVAEVVGLNLLSGQAVDTQHVTVGSTRITVAGGPADGAAWVAISPSAIALYAERPDGSPRNTWQVTVHDIQLAGQSARVHLGGVFGLTAEVTPAAVADLRLHAGQRVWATVKATEVRAYPA